ncbi:MAG: cell division/cell wall cluster transcriptional repressor MraZ [Dysgonamonadaceae bacterium]|jgi:MraZ protein|nr:cell division/cell wall cluster transcriptional repressor MraZ [Dysgonamonadaceae bacterium]
MERFIGNIDAKTDIKGRVFVPATFRKILQAAGETHLVLRKDIFQECLILYPASVWNDELSELRSKLNKWDEEEQQVFRQFSLEVEILEMDANGRILIPKKYMQSVKITTDVRFVGLDHTIEIWNREILEKTALSPDTFKNSVKKCLGSK